MTHVAGGGGRKQWNKELVWLKSHGQGKRMNKYRKSCSPDTLKSLIKSDRMYLFCGLLFCSVSFSSRGDFEYSKID